MFDHLVPPRPKKALYRVRAHHHIEVGAIVLGVITAVFIVLLSYQPQFAPVGLALEPRVIVRIVSPQIDRSVVQPFASEPIVDIDLTVRQTPLLLTELRFTLDGIYDVGALHGIALRLDGAQIGLPVLPDEYGVVAFTSDDLVVAPGVHRLSIVVESAFLPDGSALQVVFDPSNSFTFLGAKYNFTFKEPARAPLIRAVQQGSLGAYSRGDINQALVGAEAKLFLTANGEDFKASSLSLSADQRLEGSRIDIFYEGSYLTSGFVAKHAVSFTFDTDVLRILRARPTELTLRIRDADLQHFNEPSSVLYLTNLTGEGYTSHRTVKSDLSVDIL